MRFRDLLLTLYMTAFFTVTPIQNTVAGEKGKDQTKQGNTLQIRDPAGNFYTWTKEFPDTVPPLDTIGVFQKLPSGGFYSDNLSSIVEQLAPDSMFKRWTATPVPTFYGTNVSSGVPFDSIARALGDDINLNTGRQIISEAPVTAYGILFQYVDGDSSWADLQYDAGGYPELATLNVAKNAYDPSTVIGRLFARALGFSWTVDNTSVSGGASFSPLDWQSLNALFGHPAGYDLRPSASDTSRGDTEKPEMGLSGPATVTTNTPFTLDASQSTGAIEYQWDTDFTGIFDPDTITSTATLDHSYTSADPSDKTVMVVGRDANNNHNYASIDILVTPEPSAPEFLGHHVCGSAVNIGLRIDPRWYDASGLLNLTYTISSTDFPNLQINASIGSLFLQGAALEDSLAGNNYYAIVSATNQSGYETTGLVEWIINAYTHLVDIFYLKDGQTQTFQFNGTDRTTNLARNEMTPAGFFPYSIQSTPVQLQEVADRIVNRPSWAEEDFLHYNFSTVPSWGTISSTLDSVLQNLGPYELRSVSFTVTQH